MAAYLNSTGLTQVLQAVKSAIPTTLAALSDDSTHRLVTDTEKATWPKIFTGTCATAAATTTKVVDCPEFTANDLVKGAKIFVTFSATNSGGVASLYMNVNSTGSKRLKKLKSAAVADLSAAGELIANVTYLFIYDGTNWVCMTLDYNSNTTYSSMTEAEITAGTGTTARTITPARLKTAIQTWDAIKSIQLNGTTITPNASKVVNIEIPDWGPFLNPGLYDNNVGKFAKLAAYEDGGDYLYYLDYEELVIPTESTIASWGFTKNAGTLTTETDPVFSASPAASITAADIINWNSKTSNVGTLTGVTFNGAQATVTSGVAAITASIPNVPSWALANTKPSYTLDEVTDGTTRKLTNYLTKNGGLLNTDGSIGVSDSMSCSASFSASTIALHHSSDGISLYCPPDSFPALYVYDTYGSIQYTSRGAHWYVSNGGEEEEYQQIFQQNKSGTIALLSDIPSAVTESTVSGWGFTKNAGTITGITMNGASKGTSGVVNLGTVLTEHQDISGKANLNGAAFTGAVTGTSSGNTAQFRNITISTQAPSGGNDGDVWIVYQN